MPLLLKTIVACVGLLCLLGLLLWLIARLGQGKGVPFLVRCSKCSSRRTRTRLLEEAPQKSPGAHATFTSFETRCGKCGHVETELDEKDGTVSVDVRIQR